MRNLIVLSDGTGNGAAKRNKTNVWRLYRALDLHRDDQIAAYDDGVGAGESTFSKILGGAFGFGLKRNVIELYMFLCRNYRAGATPGGAGDRIYLFGFSRGGFTVRLLAGFIADRGLCTSYRDEEDLARKARAHYALFRERFRRGALTRLWRRFFRPPEPEGETVRPPIAFLGVWDTVDAYGFPIDELAVLWDRLIYPIRFPDRILSASVERACQALAVDDERLTFHPLLWDESAETDKARIEQVWFAGVHADVGGGYPMHELALVSLDWMMRRVEPEEGRQGGLHFVPRIREEIWKLSDWHGQQHDSRAGTGAIYRYKPRNIARLCADPQTGVAVTRPKIHRSVFERIAAGAVPYAPAGLPETYAVATTRTGPRSYESDEEARQREAAMGVARDIVFWRRVLHAGLLATTLVLLASRYLLDWTPEAACAGIACAWDPLLRGARDLLPDLAAGWIEALRQNPGFLLAILAAYAVLLGLRVRARKATLRAAAAAWSALKRGKPPREGYRPGLTARLRALAEGAWGRALNRLAAGIVFVLLLSALLVLLDRTVLHLRGSFGALCADASGPGGGTVRFSPSEPCFATGLRFSRGDEVRVRVTSAGLRDGTIAADADGFRDPADARALLLFVPLRRHRDQPWFRLMGRIGAAGDETFPLGEGRHAYRARSDGELFLYVNDAVFGLAPGRAWSLPYRWAAGVNTGTLTVTVTVSPDR